MKKVIRPILLVEDDPVDLDLIRKAFFRREILNPFQAARDGEEALGYLEHWDQGESLPVLILLDLKLPKVDGLEVLRQMKNHVKYCVIPIVVLTASSAELDIREACRLGANSYIIKPADCDQFMEAAGYIGLYWCQINQIPGQ